VREPGSGSFRDPENAAVPVEGQWFRVASQQSAIAARMLRASAVYADLVGSGTFVAYDEVGDDALAARVRSTYARTAGRPAPPDAVVFAVESIDLVTYPWEWANSSLAAAARLTLDVRTRLLSIGLDLKDASAFNVQFRGLRPVFIDVGSVHRWRPNPSWNAARQFIEHFVNPLAVGSGDRVTAADAWVLGRHRGLRSDVARQVMPARRRRSLSLSLLQASTRPVAENAPSEVRYADQANAQTDLARRATLALTRRLGKQVDRLPARAHATTWVDYGARAHYGREDLDRKSALATAFVTAAPGRADLVLDVGGNDGFTAAHLARHAGASVVVMDADAGALDVLHAGIGAVPELAGRVSAVLGDLTNLTPGSGLLDREFTAFTDRIRPSAVICQAVLHHVVITQAVPMTFAVDALARFGAPVQIEFATPEDDKVRLLIGQIPNWQGEYSTEALLAALRRRYADVAVRGTTSPTRVVVDAWNLLA